MSLEDGLRKAAGEGKLSVAQKLIGKGADVNAAEEVDGWAPLHYAANGNSTGHHKVAQALLEAGADVDIKNREGETALHLAAARGDEQMVDVLLEHNASVTLEDNRGRSAFLVAYENYPALAVKINASKKLYGRTRTDPAAILGIGVDKQQKKQKAEAEQELREAAEEDDLIGVEEVLDVYKDIDIDAVDDQGNSALWLAAFNGRQHIVKELLERGADPGQARTDSGQTPLHISADEGFVNVVKILLPKLTKSQVDTRDSLGRTPLLVASSKGHADVVQAILSGKADINLANNKNESPLYVAASEGHSEVVEALLDAPEPQRSVLEIDAPNELGYTPLHAAARQGNIIIARGLLDRGANKEARDNRGQTPLFLAAEAGQTRMTGVLVDEYKADVNSSNLVGETPLFVSSLKGHVTVVQVLIENGGDTEAAEDRGITPLMIAAQDGQSAVIAKLLEHGANVHATNNVGETPLLIAALEGYHYAVGILLENGAELKAAQREGKTALHLASRDGHVGVVRVLLNWATLEEDSEVEEKLYLTPLHMTADTRGETALHLAVRFGHTSVAQLLLEHDEYTRERQKSFPEESGNHISSLIYGTLVDAPNKYGWTALHVAVDSHQGPLLVLLINKKANVNASDKFGNKPLHLASRQRDERMVSDLLTVPEIDVSAVNVFGRTALHFAAACVRPSTIIEQLNNGVDPHAQDKNGDRPMDVLGNKDLCNPGYVIDNGMCNKSPIESTPYFSGDFCPIAQGVGTGMAESEAILQMAMSKNPSIKEDPVLQSPVPLPRPPLSPSGNDSVVVPVVAAVIPLFAILLFLIFTIFKLAKKRQNQRHTNYRAEKKGKTFNGRVEATFATQSSQNIAEICKKGCSPRTAESVPADHQFIADPRNMIPFSGEELHLSPLGDAEYEDHSDCGTSSEDGSCCWSDDSADSSPDRTLGPRGSGLSGINDPRATPEIRVVRTLSKSSSDGEMHERERHDALGPLPTKRSPQYRHARGWLVGRSSSGRRLIGLKGRGWLPPKSKLRKESSSKSSAEAPDRIQKASGSFADISNHGGLPTFKEEPGRNFQGPSLQVCPEHNAACKVEMQRQWSWS